MRLKLNANMIEKNVMSTERLKHVLVKCLSPNISTNNRYIRIGNVLKITKVVGVVSKNRKLAIVSDERFCSSRAKLLYMALNKMTADPLGAR
jgi:hypothetical protein